MGYVKARMQQQAPRNEERHSSGCHSHGCPMVGSVSVAGGQFICSYHAAVQDPKRWPSITSALRDNDWHWQLLADLQRLYNSGQFADARAMAVDFWRDQDDTMVPNADEALHFDAYLDRMRSDLAWRIGVQRDRPKAWKAPEKRPGGNLVVDFA